MRIHVTSVFVDDQAEALEFYTKTLGFEKKTDLPAGGYRWLTVVAPDQRDGVELLLEPSAHAAVQRRVEARRNPVRLVRDRRCRTGVPPSSGLEREFHPGADGVGWRSDGGLRRYLRQPGATLSGDALNGSLSRSGRRPP